MPRARPTIAATPMERQSPPPRGSRQSGSWPAARRMRRRRTPHMRAARYTPGGAAPARHDANQRRYRRVFRRRGRGWPRAQCWWGAGSPSMWRETRTGAYTDSDTPCLPHPEPPNGPVAPRAESAGEVERGGRPLGAELLVAADRVGRRERLHVDAAGAKDLDRIWIGAHPPVGSCPHHQVSGEVVEDLLQV